MEKLIWLVVAMASSAAFAQQEPFPQQDGDVTVVWQEPDKYRDVESSSGIQSRYQNHVFAKLGKHLQQKITPQLQAGETLTITVTDLDLAGDVRPTFGATTNDIRVVKSVYPPMIHFNYRLKDEDGEVVQEEKVELKDLGFDSNSIRRYRGEPLHYEMKMLDHWITKSLTPRLVKQ